MRRDMLKLEGSNPHQGCPLNARSRAIVLTALIAIGLMAFPNPVAPANSDPIEVLLARARAALGPGLGSVQSISTSGTVEVAGIRGTFQSWIDRSSGHYSIATDLGPLSSSEGYDANGAWWSDAKGIVLPQTGAASRAHFATEVFSNSDALLSPDHGGAKLSYLGTRIESGRTYEVVKIRVPHGYTEEDWYDSATALVTRRRVNIDLGVIITDFSNYENCDGLMVPHKGVMSNGSITETVTLTGCRANSSDLAGHIRRPTAAVNDFSLNGGQTVIPFQYVDHEIFVDVYINGKGPFRFGFDTGAGNLIDPTVAWEAGARTFGTGVPGGGIGKGIALIRFAQASQLTIGGATLRDQYFRVEKIERPFGTVAGVNTRPGPQGLIGWEVLARFVTTIDYVGSKIILRTPAANPGAPAGQTSIPLLFDHASPEFNCVIGAVDATCLLDTGSSWSVTVSSAFSRKHRSITPRFFDQAGYSGAGLSGPSGGVRGPLGSFQIGPIRLTNLDAEFSLDREGFLANHYVAAIVGNRIWNQFTLTVDYPHATMYLSPSPAVDRQ
jgi:Aspartyl protease